MHIPGTKLARRALRPLARTFFPGAVVLGYHRIADLAWDPLAIAVTPTRFAAQIEALADLREVISLGALAARHAAGEPLDRYAVLTFDDGYSDFATTVLPLVERFGFPATVFVTSGCIGHGFWWEDIAAMLAPGPREAAVLEVALHGELVQFPEMGRSEARAGATRAICNALACASEQEILAVMDQIRRWPGAALGTPVAGAPMSPAQVESLGRHPLAEVGAHGVSHGCLGQLALPEQRREIGQSKAALEAMTGNRVTVFSYPNGSCGARTPGLVEELGFSCACTSRDGAFTSRGHRFRIPRIWVPDVDVDPFRQWLGGWVRQAG